MDPITSIPAWSVDKRFPSDLEIAHDLIEQTIKAMEERNWAGGEMFHVQMAMEEAVVNAIEHGNKRDSQKFVHVVIHVDIDRVSIDIRDEGPGFDHRNVADPTQEDRIDQPRGRGVMLIRELMTESSYNECGNHLVMTKRRGPPSE
jgi:serine/threonine-protein kinase RsbW